MNRIIKEKIKQVIIMLIIVITFLVSIFIMLRYKTEGETNLPFNLSKIMIISSAEAVSKNENPDNNKWNLNINQYNDIYIEIAQNEQYKKQSYIEEVRIENIYVSTPAKGEIKKYMPSTSAEKTFTYDSNLEIINSLTYQGAEANETKQLKIANQGGTVLFRIVNQNVSEFVSNDDAEIAHDGTLLNKTNVGMDEIKVDVSFDIIIKTEQITYRGKINTTLPCGNIDEEGVSTNIIEDFSNVVFKREK